MSQTLQEAHSFTPATSSELAKTSSDAVFVYGSAVNAKVIPYAKDVAAPDYVHIWDNGGSNDTMTDHPDENTITISDCVNTNTKDTDHIIE